MFEEQIILKKKNKLSVTLLESMVKIMTGYYWDWRVKERGKALANKFVYLWIKSVKIQTANKKISLSLEKQMLYGMNKKKVYFTLDLNNLEKILRKFLR